MLIPVCLMDRPIQIASLSCASESEHKWRNYIPFISIPIRINLSYASIYPDRIVRLVLLLLLCFQLSVSYASVIRVVGSCGSSSISVPPGRLFGSPPFLHLVTQSCSVLVVPLYGHSFPYIRGSQTPQAENTNHDTVPDKTFISKTSVISRGPSS